MGVEKVCRDRRHSIYPQVPWVRSQQYRGPHDFGADLALTT